jgi:hypothetical protein
MKLEEGGRLEKSYSPLWPSIKVKADERRGTNPAKIGTTGQGWVFITSQPTMREALRPLISLWIDLLVLRLLNEPMPQQKPAWFVIDELASLQHLPSLPPIPASDLIRTAVISALHLTLKNEATKPPATNFLQQQACFDRFVEVFNRERPHAALDLAMLSSWQRSWDWRLPAQDLGGRRQFHLLWWQPLG